MSSVPKFWPEPQPRWFSCLYGVDHMPKDLGNDRIVCVWCGRDQTREDIAAYEKRVEAMREQVRKMLAL